MARGVYIRKPFTKNHRENLSESHKGQVSWAKGRAFSDNHKENLSNSHKGIISGFKNKEHSRRTKEKMSRTRIEKKIGVGENHYNWQGGKSFEPYTSEFNGKLKKFIRERDNNICQFCGKTKKKNGQELSVNHINYIKEDCRPRNLIALCRSDNAKVNYEREKWQFLFETLQEIRDF